ncbi:ankyrin repeat domain-containing protein [Isosphaeraceae bacterium EP7]
MSSGYDENWTSDALERGDVDAVRRRVLDDPTYLRSRELCETAPLMFAVQFDDADLVRFMLDHGAAPDPDVDDGYTTLLTAIESTEPASTQIVSMLIEAGADIHRTGMNGYTPLHMAASKGHAEKARLLLDAGATIDRRKEIDAAETPLMEAAFSGRVETVRLLLERGADPTLRDTIQERTPLEIAEYSSKGPDPDVLEYLKSVYTRPRSVADLCESLDLTPETRAMMEEHLPELDMVEQYRACSERIAREGDFEGVIRLLSVAIKRPGHDRPPTSR